jgi:hypothetical protein
LVRWPRALNRLTRNFQEFNELRKSPHRWAIPCFRGVFNESKHARVPAFLP